MRRVAITGVGAVTPLGNDAASTWAAALEGRSGIAEISAFDTSNLPVRIAGEVKDFDPTGAASPKDLRKLDRNVVFALAAAKEALADAGTNGFRPTIHCGQLLVPARPRRALSVRAQVHRADDQQEPGQQQEWAPPPRDGGRGRR